MPLLPPPTSGSRFTASVLSTHSSDSSPSLLVAFDSKRYLFNTPEAISRIALQSKVGLRKVSNVFLGSLDESAGLPGFVLSTVEAGNTKIEVVGPDGTEHFLASCRYFTRRDKLSLKVTTPPRHEHASPNETPSLPSPIHSDENVHIYAFPSSSRENGRRSPDAPIAVDERSPSTSLKRKRSSSSTPPPVRTKSPPRSPRSRSSTPEASATNGSAFNPGSPSFQPGRLHGQDAQTWTKMVIKDMFRGTAFDPVPSRSVVAETSTAREGAEPVKPVRGAGRTPTPAYLAQPLPRFRGDATEALSYLVVGPAVIGKFLPSEAIKRGLTPGEKFARLKMGERVWVRERSDEEIKRDKVAEEKRLEEERASGKKETKKEKQKREKEEKLRREQEDATFIDGEGPGRWVDPQDCMEPGENATAFLVLNVPSPAHVPSLSTSLPPSILLPSSLGSNVSLKAIFYFLGPSVSSSTEFQTYFSSLRSTLSSDVEHHFSTADDVRTGKDEVTFGPSALLNLRLSKLDPDMFRIPRYSFVSGETDPEVGSITTETLRLPDGASSLSSNSHFNRTVSPLPPSQNPFGSEVRSFNFSLGSETAEREAGRLKGTEKPLELQQKAEKFWEAYVEAAQAAKARVQVEETERRAAGKATAKPEHDLVVTPLGTGSAIPSKYRNVSSTLLHLPPRPDAGGMSKPEREYVLLDAGEGTWGQISRRFGATRRMGPEGHEEDSAEDVLKGIKMIFISHLHQDHHAGLAMLLKKRAQLEPPATDPLTIVAPPNARTYLVEQAQLFELGLAFDGDVRFIDNFFLEPGKTLTEGSRASTAYEAVLKQLDLEAILAVPVLHRCRAWGIVITHNSGWRAVFSGDTMPCEDLVEHGRGANLVIHEATIEDDLPEVALAKGHSTFAQAIDIATRMRADHLLLTHFSARYPKVPPVSAASTTGDTHELVVATAFDLMSLKLSEFWKVERYRDAMDILLKTDEADGDDGEVSKTVEVRQQTP
ncbi:hypothetical protein JCM10212_000982 [Sporobolomyces blumeae]